MTDQPNELLTIGDLRKFTLEPGDALVIHLKFVVTADVANRVRELVQDVFSGVRVLILDNDTEIFCIRQAPPEATP